MTDPRFGDPESAVAGHEVLGTIGRGAYADVYRVRRDGSEYALKLLRSGGPDSEALITAFHREAALLACLHHPGITRVHEVGTADGRPYMLMDLAEGERLTEVLARGRLTEAQVIATGIAIAGALAAAHDAELVHRDVKPDNIVLAADGTARLIDFGLAARTAEHHDASVAGTIVYSAPEQSGMLERPVDGRADLYALGAVLYECATGAPPFVADDVGGLLRLHAATPAPDPRERCPELSETLAAILLRLLAKDPDDRYQRASSLCADLRHLASEPDAEITVGGADALESPAPDTPLIGRAAELTELTDRWQRARDGHGGVALIQAPPGGGKSRLAREAVAHVRRSGALVLYGKSAPDDSLPLAPLRAAIDGYLRSVQRLPPSERGAAVQRVVAAVGAVAPLLTRLSAELAALLDLPDGVGEVAPEQFAGAVAAFIGELARSSGGAVVHLDDVQWADEVTCAVLRHLAAVLSGTPLLVLATGRDDDASRDAVESFRSAVADGLDLEVMIPPLGAEDAAALVASVSAGLTIDDEAASMLVARTHGNPFTLLEYIKAIVDAGLAHPHWGTWRLDLDGLSRLDLPEDAAELVLKRIAALDVESRWLLGACAVVGAHFSADLVASVANVDSRRVLDLVADAAWHRLVERRGKGFGFVHDRIREALLGQLDPQELRGLHDRVADALDQRGAKDPATAYALAHHYLQGDVRRDPVRAFRASATAGGLALADHAPAQAVSFLESAADVATAADIPTDAEFLETLGVAYHRAGHFDRAVEAFHRALGATTDPLERARILVLVARVHDSTWSTADQLAAVDQGLGELGRPLPTNRFRLALGTLWMFAVGCLIGATGIGYGTARGRRRAVTDVTGALYEVATQAYTRDLRGGMAALIALREVYLVNRLGTPRYVAHMKGGLGLLAALVGLRRASDRLCATAAKVAAGVGDPTLQAHVAWLHGVARHATGADGGESLARVIDEHGRWLDVGLHLDCFAILGWDWLLHGDMAQLEEGFRRRRTLTATIGGSARTAGLAVEAGLPALRGQPRDAAEHLVRLRAIPDPAAGQRVDLCIATLQSEAEQSEFGAVFDEAVAEFERFGFRPHELFPVHHTVYVHIAYGRMEQCRIAPAEEWAARLDTARRAIATLGKVARRPILIAHHRVLKASLLEISGEPDAALATLAAEEPLLRAVDAPLVAFEAARVRARALRKLNVVGEVGRQASYALAIAQEQGWPHRSRWVTAEFGAHATSPGSRSSTDSVASEIQRTRLAALEQVSLAASTVLDPDQLARIALDETIRIFGADRAFLFLVEGQPPRPVPHLGRDSARNELTELTGYGGTLVEKVVQSREALAVAGTEQGAVLGSQSMMAHGLRSIMVAPLLLDNRLLGVVYLDSRVAKGIFTVDDIGILTAITNHVAVALETARAAQLEVAVAAARRQRDLAEMLNAAMAELSGTLDPADVLWRLLATARRLLGGHQGWLLTRAQIAANRRLGPLLEISAPVVASSGDQWPAAFTDAAPGTNSWMAVPLTVRSELVGVLVLASEQSDAYGPAQLETVAAMVGQGMTAYENARLFAQIRQLATIDDLSGLANRRHFLELAAREIRSAGRHGRPLAAIMVDIDRFKPINDTHGHQVGDDVIRAVAARLREESRDIDLVGRYGGEEFALVLPDVGDTAPAVAERIRGRIAAEPVPTSAGLIDVTISMGVAYLRPADTEPFALLGRADECLYRAKNAGRNRVVVHEESSPAV